ncbi:MAG TPA: ATP-binding cassette domain-containing protein [Gammaproteobacteria bacterium]|nr:ATP-binding cassette domain-containing protein [Gammaproteobacteria bacterium]
MPQLDVTRGTKLALIGESGSGKSTLLELLAMILMPTEAGAFSFAPEDGGPASDLDAIWRARGSDALSELRSRYIGYVLQHGGLLPYLSVRRNIELPRQLLGLEVDGVAENLADKLGIAQQLDKLPSALSVGQRQRAAIGRALAHEPPIVIADEPTAAIDPLNAQRIMALLVDLVEALGVTLILATHAHELVRQRGFTLLPLEVQASDGQSMTVTVQHG